MTASSGASVEPARCISPSLDPAAQRRLARLARRVRDDLKLLNLGAARAWTRGHLRCDEPLLDVLIVGGGQGGLATAFALRCEGVSSFRIIDRAPHGREGPWRTYARMETLRTPKTVVGLDLGIPSLTARAWYEARYGRRAWDAILSIPREHWNLYLDWFRDTLQIPVENGITLLKIEPEGEWLRATLHGPAGSDAVLARKIVMATGLEGSGVWYFPALIRERLPPTFYAHGSSEIDFSQLRGKRVAIIGAGASGFDNAAAALEAGAARVELFMRRPDLPRVNPLQWFDFSASVAHFADLPDLYRWRMGRSLIDRGIPPPESALRRVAPHDNFVLRADAEWRDLRANERAFTIATKDGASSFDFVICATSADPNPRARPEFAAFAEEIALWADRFTPPPGEESAALGAYPYLGPAYEFTERNVGTAPWLRHIHNFSFAAVGSMGSAGGVTSLKFALPRLVRGITRDLFLDDAHAHVEDFLAFNRGELAADLVDALKTRNADPRDTAGWCGGEGIEESLSEPGPVDQAR